MFFFLLTSLFQIYGVGWFANNPHVLYRVGREILQTSPVARAEISQTRRTFVAKGFGKRSDYLPDWLWEEMISSLRTLFRGMCTIVSWLWELFLMFDYIGMLAWFLSLTWRTVGFRVTYTLSQIWPSFGQGNSQP